jgi:hypothetical protein
MQINQLSAQIDQKLNELDQRLVRLNEQHRVASGSEQAQLGTDIQALELIKNKLLKSRDIAWRAHELQQEHQDLKQLERKRWIGLTLCVLSAIGAVVLIGIIWWTEFR